jgi:D-serine deaminase-like pyridoxal phosphate-dependent protein
MAAYTDSIGFNKGTAAFPADVNSVSKFEVVLDFAAINAARTAAGATALAAADTLQVINLPANAVVLTAGIEVLTTDASTATFDLGFTGGSPAAANAYANDAAISTLGYTIADLANPTAVKVADTIDLLINTAAPTTGKIRVFAVVADVS